MSLDFKTEEDYKNFYNDVMTFFAHNKDVLERWNSWIEDREKLLIKLKQDELIQRGLRILKEHEEQAR